MRLTLAPGQWPGDDFPSVLAAAKIGEEAGLPGVWFSEVNGFDGVGLSSVAANRWPSLEVTLGPVIAGVRSPAQMAMAAATIAHISEIAPRIVVGAGNRRIVRDWHGREVSDLVGHVRDHVAALRQALAGEKTDGPSSHDFRLAVDPPGEVRLGIAALGPRMTALAGACADFVVFNLVPPDRVKDLRDRVWDRADSSGRQRPETVVWMIVGSVEVSGPRVTSLLRPYFAAEGYVSALASVGVDENTDPDVALGVLTALGPPSVAVDRIHQYSSVGVDEVVLVGSSQDPAYAEVTTVLSSVFNQNVHASNFADDSGDSP